MSNSLSQESHLQSNKKHRSENSRWLFYMLFEKENQSSLYVYKITRATFYNWRKQWDNSKSVKPLNWSHIDS